MSVEVHAAQAHREAQEADPFAAGVSGAEGRLSVEDAGVVRMQDDGVVSSEVEAAASPGNLAARMRAAHSKLKARTKAFEVPPYDVWGGGLVAVLHSVELVDGKPYQTMIVEATEAVYALDEPGAGYTRTADGFEPHPDGSWRRMGWADVGDLMGLSGENVTLGQVVVAVCGTPEVLMGWTEAVISFILGRASIIERALGE